MCQCVGVKFILGNDVAGGKVIPFLEVCDNPIYYHQLDEMSERFPEVFPVCVVTRAQARKLVDADDLAPLSWHLLWNVVS